MSTTEYQDPYGPGGAWYEWAEGLSPDRAAYYRSEAWRERRRERRERDGHRCVVCGFNYKRYLVCHHITYKNFGNEPLEDLRTVCADCHRTASAAELRQERPIEKYLEDLREKEEEAEFWEEYRVQKELEHDWTARDDRDFFHDYVWGSIEDGVYRDDPPEPAVIWPQ